MAKQVKYKLDGTIDRRSIVKNRAGGRKSKAEEQTLIEKLTPLEPKAFKALEDALDDGQAWAVKLYMQYKNGMPKEVKDITINKELPIFNIDLGDE